MAGRSIDVARAEDIDRRCGEIFAALNATPRPLPGVGELVGTIVARGMAWAIATSSRREQVGASIRALALQRKPRIVDGSHVEHAKPEPDLLLLGARELGLEPARCWYIGDSTWDVAAAIAAGMLPIAVTAGAAVSGAVLEGAGAAAVAGTLADVVALLPDSL